VKALFSTEIINPSSEGSGDGRKYWLSKLAKIQLFEIIKHILWRRRESNTIYKILTILYHYLIIGSLPSGDGLGTVAVRQIRFTILIIPCLE
jgi:hypothetical protein